MLTRKSVEELDKELDKLSEDWEEWQELTEAQQDAQVDREMDSFTRWWDTLTFDQQIKHSRTQFLQSCLRCRNRLDKYKNDTMSGPGSFIYDEVFKKHLKSAQARLLRLRHSRAAGRWLGNVN